MLRRFLRWCVRVRYYSELGTYYFPALDLIVPIVYGVIEQNLISALVVYGAIKFAATILGYLDVKYLKRIQYINQFSIEMNPVIMEIRKNVKHRRAGRKTAPKARPMAERFRRIGRKKPPALLWS